MGKKDLEEEAFEMQERVVGEIFENIDLFEEKLTEYEFIEQMNSKLSRGDYLTPPQWRRVLKLHSRIPQVKKK